MARELLSYLVPTLVAQTINDMSLNRFALLNSGSVTQDATISQYISGPGKLWQLPSYVSPDSTAVGRNVPTSDSSVLAVPELITTKFEQFVKTGAHRSFAVNSMIEDSTGSDPLTQVYDHASDMMNKWRQATLVAQLNALLLNTGAVVSNNALKLASESNAGVSAATKLGNGVAPLFNTMAKAWSDNDPESIVLVMHPDAYYSLVQQNFAATTIPLAQNLPKFKSFLGYPVWLDRNVGKRNGTTDAALQVYTVYMFRTGGIKFGQAEFKPSFELDRVMQAGNGAGQDLAALREYYTFHVPGTSFTGTITTDLPSDIDLGTATNFALINDPTRVGVAAFTVNL